MQSLRCVAHYSSSTYKYSELIVLSENAHLRLLEAKQMRNDQGVENEHKDQSALIPDHLDPSVHGIHMEPCYKKFTLIISQIERKSLDIEKHSNPKQLRSCSKSRVSASTVLFPDHCYFCKTKKKKVGGKIQLPHKLTLLSAEESLKLAAKEKNDTVVLRDIHGVDLLAKEFQVHDKCRLDYIRKIPEKETNLSLNEEIGNFELVKSEIQSKIIENARAVSMKVIHTLYEDDHDGDSRYRNKLKKKILKEFPDKLYFLQIDGRSSEVIVSKEGIKSSTLPNEKTSVLHKAAKFIRNDILEFGENCRELNWPPSRGVTIHDATIRYVSRYKPQDTVYDTIRKTRYRHQQLMSLNNALDPDNEKTKTEYTKNSSYNTVLVSKQSLFLAQKTVNHITK